VLLSLFVLLFSTTIRESSLTYCPTLLTCVSHQLNKLSVGCVSINTVTTSESLERHINCIPFYSILFCSPAQYSTVAVVKLLHEAHPDATIVDQECPKRNVIHNGIYNEIDEDMIGYLCASFPEALQGFSQDRCVQCVWLSVCCPSHSAMLCVMWCDVVRIEFPCCLSPSLMKRSQQYSCLSCLCDARTHDVVQYCIPLSTNIDPALLCTQPSTQPHSATLTPCFCQLLYIHFPHSLLPPGKCHYTSSAIRMSETDTDP
jgi:hypothetical protein